MNISLTKITAPPGGSLVEKIKKEEIKKTIIEGFCSRLTSTDNNPIKSPDMVWRLGIVGDKEEYQKILNITWIPPTYLDKDTKYILLNMKKTQTSKALRDIKVEIARESFVYHWRRSRENTLSSISRLHFGHYKSTAISALISETHAIFFHICTTSGFFTPHWPVGINFILLNVPGGFLIYKLRAML